MKNQDKSGATRFTRNTRMLAAWSVALWMASGGAALAAACSTLADAANAPGLVWTTGGHAEWFAQGDVVHAGGSCAAQAGAITHNQSSWIETTITNGPGLAMFYWRVSSEMGWDVLSFSINDDVLAETSGGIDWHFAQFELEPGSSSLRWSYAKDGSVSEGQDTGWMTDFTFLPFTGRFISVTGNLDFGKVPLNTVSQKTIVVRSLGDDPLVVTDVLVPEGFSADPTSFTLATQAATNITISFAPTVGQVYTGLAVVVSDAQSGPASLPASGMGLLIADRFVWTNSPSPAPPYTNWVTAAHVLQDALSLASEGDTVWVTNGVYDTGGATAFNGLNRAVVPTGVVLRSVNGPAVTHIVGAADPATTNAFGLGPATVRGVALYDHAVLDGFTVRDGRAGSTAIYGGGVMGQSSASFGYIPTSIVRNSIVVSNVAMLGGGLAMVNADNVIVEHNHAVDIGGGIVLVSANRSRIAYNTAPYGGGGAVFSMSNCVVVGNTASIQVGGILGLMSGEIESCTIVGNEAPIAGGVASVIAKNCLIYYNTATLHPNYIPAAMNSGCSLRYSCSTPLPEGPNESNNIDDEPRIVGLNHPHLLADSPCINAGTNTLAMIDVLDFDGDPRINDGRVDIGADEFWAHSLTDTLHVAISFPFGPVVAVNYPLPMLADINGRCSMTLWEVDNTALTNRPFIDHTFTNTGLFEVRLSASNLLGTVSTVVTVTVQEAEYYVATNGNDEADGLTWLTAKQTIQAAVDAGAIPGGTVLVSNGVYNTGSRAINGLTNRIAATYPITIRSVNGPDVTVIEGARDDDSQHQLGCGPNAVRCAYLSGGATLEGFTLAGGRSGTSSTTASGGGVYSTSSKETLVNCVIVDCAAAGPGGGAYQGALTGCRIYDNTSDDYGGGAYFSAVWHSRITGNRAMHGGGLARGTAQNSLISGNSAANSGGGGHDVQFQSCTVIANTALQGGGAFRGALENTVLYYNEAVDGSNWHAGDFYEPTTLSYSCTTPMPLAGTGNITNAPILSGLHGGRLLPGSPCIGAGLVQDWMTDATDCDGEPRLNGTATDIGWDQLWIDACTNELVMAIAFPEGNRVAPGFTLPVVAADEEGRLLGLVWDFGDGSGATNEAFTAHAWASEGEKIITFTATNLAYTAIATATVMVENTATHVAASGDDEADGTSWATAKQTIQAGVDASAYGGLVLVSNGVYQTGARVGNAYGTSNRVVLTRQVTLRSVNGPEVTVIAGQPTTGGTTGQNAIRCVFMMPSTRLEGFTLTSGYSKSSDYGGGIYALDTTAIISNCVVTGNEAFSGGGGVYRGTIFNSRLEHNTSGPDFGGGGASHAHLFDCVVTSNTSSFTRGGGVAYGSATRSQITGNAAAYGGGGTYHTILSNCVVRGNSGGSGYGSGMWGGSAFNALIVENTTTSTLGATYSASLYNCTVAGNTGGGIRLGFAINSISYDNTEHQWFAADDGANLLYTCTTPLPAGAGCITNAPMLSADYRLTAASPAINTGTNQAWMTGATDLNGDARIQKVVADMGAYESDAWGMYADIDGDGFTDWVEVNQLGTDPADPNSYLGVSGLGTPEAEGEGIVVRWLSVEGIHYNIARATNLVENPAFTSWMTSVIGWPDATSVTDTTATAEGPYFYRVEIEP